MVFQKSSARTEDLNSHQQNLKKFLSNWGVRHRLSSVKYPQSNGRAELAVKAGKRLIHDNTNPNGSLDNDKAARALLQHRNTPIQELGLSPAQILLHRQLRDSIPARPMHYRLHKDWIISAEERERAFAKRNQGIKNSYNEHSLPLSPLNIQTAVQIQDKGRWKKTGRVTEVLPNRQYRIRMDGSGRVTLRNRRFLKPLTHPQQKIQPFPTPSAPIPNEAISPDVTSQQNIPETQLDTESIQPQHKATETQPNTELVESQQQARPPRMLRDIADHNNRGLRESAAETTTRCLRSGREH